MLERLARGTTGLLLLALVAAACGGESDADAVAPDSGSTTLTSLTTTTTVATTTTAAPTTTLPPAPTSTTVAMGDRPHVVHEQAWVPYATVGEVVLVHPSDRVEAIGFHQSGHDGAQHQVATDTAVRTFVMTSRERDTDAQGAADVLIEPGRAIRVPVTGTVVRGGSYTLYCDYTDEYAVIEPDAHPGWEVKILHMEGLAVTKGQRVEAGVTPLAAHARVLPFASQVEESTGTPPWPHVHVEVVDPTVPDRPTGPGCD